MSAQLKPARPLEIAHVLFIDVVGYSRLLVNEQRAVVEELNEIVRQTPQFRASDAAGKLIRIPAGDGMALVFFQSPEEPVRCAVEIARALRDHPQIRVRMGIHSGPVDEVTHVDDRSNVAGAGMNIAQRVMDFGDAGHILLSRRVAEDLTQDAQWHANLHDLGEVEAKHVQKIGIVNLFNEEFGNPELPAKVKQVRQRSHLRRNAIVISAAAIVILALGIVFFVLPRAAADKVEKSIAVLPFENLSDDKENAYFADGIQDDILTNLSKIGDLKVISRTSVMQYRGQTANVRDIGKELGVSTLLEGSVRRIGNRVRVNVQLIDATNDKHIWANDYDRDVSDVFAIQADLAREIASALQATLSPAEKLQMERKPTENGEAYLAFLQAHTLYLQGLEDLDKLRQSKQLFERAIQLDPNFALAYARYSQLESWLLHTQGATAENKAKSRTLAERALQLQPDLPEAHLARGFSYYYADKNYEAALREFEIAKHGLPNESEAYLAIGAIQRRQGKWNESTVNIAKAAELNPKDSWPLQNLVFNYQMNRNFDAANKTVDRALKINPMAFGLWEIKSKLALSERGDLTVADEALAKLNSSQIGAEDKLRAAKATIDVLLFKRQYRELLETGRNIPDKLLEDFPGALPGKYLVMGIANKMLGDKAAAQTAWLKAKELIEGQLERSPDEPSPHVQLGLVLAFLGDRDGALREAERATEVLPESKDAFDGPSVTEGVAEIYAVLGENARAIELLEGLLNRPSSITVPMLKVNPVWDSLRADPQFQALLTKYGGEA